MSAGSEASRQEAEAAAWRTLSRYSPDPDPADVDGLVAAAEAYAAELAPKMPVEHVHQDFGTSLYPLIGLLSELMDSTYRRPAARQARHSCGYLPGSLGHLNSCGTAP